MQDKTEKDLPAPAAAAAADLRQPLAAAAALPRADPGAGGVRLPVLGRADPFDPGRDGQRRGRWQTLVNSLGYKGAAIIDPVNGSVSHAPISKLSETIIMLVVLGLIDVVMISNLLIMVIVGGYETFVSRLELDAHPDQPEWLSHVNASVLKVKLATAIIGISSIHLLKTFINAENYTEKTLMWQTLIHIAFLLSALAIAAADRVMPQAPAKH
jgi:uncharacterized protein (TIGR00645 family)